MEFISSVLHAMGCPFLSSTTPAKYLLIGKLVAILPLFAILHHSFHLQSFLVQILNPFSHGPLPLIIPPCTFLNILFPIQYPSLLIMLIENPMQSRLWWHTRLTTLCGATPVMNERSLSNYVGTKAQPKVVLMFPGSGLPSLDLWGSKSRCQETGAIARDELEDPP